MSTNVDSDMVYNSQDTCTIKLQPILGFFPMIYLSISQEHMSRGQRTTFVRILCLSTIGVSEMETSSCLQQAIYLLNNTPSLPSSPILSFLHSSPPFLPFFLPSLHFFLFSFISSFLSFFYSSLPSSLSAFHPLSLSFPYPRFLTLSFFPSPPYYSCFSLLYVAMFDLIFLAMLLPHQSSNYLFITVLAIWEYYSSVDSDL